MKTAGCWEWSTIHNDFYPFQPRELPGSVAELLTALILREQGNWKKMLRGFSASVHWPPAVHNRPEVLWNFAYQGFRPALAESWSTLLVRRGCRYLSSSSVMQFSTKPLCPGTQSSLTWKRWGVNEKEVMNSLPNFDRNISDPRYVAGRLSPL